MAELIDEATVACNLSARAGLNIEGTREAAIIYNKYLFGSLIPTKDLPLAFMHAIRCRPYNRPFCVADVDWAWGEILSNPDLRQRYYPNEQKRTSNPECKKCFGTDMEIVPGKGARRCPECRPDAYLSPEEYG